MTSLRTHATNFVIVAAGVAAIGAALLTPGKASAASHGEPWPEPPSCSNETGSCTSIEDMLAYECYFESEDSPFPFCDDPFELLRRGGNVLTAQPNPDPAPARLVIPAGRR